jgi:hypothetical protein
LQAQVQPLPATVQVPWPQGSLGVPLVLGLHASTQEALEVPWLEAMKPALQVQVWLVLGATASVQVAVASPLAAHGLPVHSFLSVHEVVPVPVYAVLLQVQV